MTGTLADPQRAVRLAIYRGFAGQGRPPSVAELAAQADLAETAVRAALRHLHEAHAIVLTGIAPAAGTYMRDLMVTAESGGEPQHGPPPTG